MKGRPRIRSHGVRTASYVVGGDEPGIARTVVVGACHHHVESTCWIRHDEWRVLHIEIRKVAVPRGPTWSAWGVRHSDAFGCDDGASSSIQDVEADAGCNYYVLVTLSKVSGNGAPHNRVSLSARGYCGAPQGGAARREGPYCAATAGLRVAERVPDGLHHVGLTVALEVCESGGASGETTQMRAPDRLAILSVNSGDSISIAGPFQAVPVVTVAKDDRRPAVKNSYSGR